MKPLLLFGCSLLSITVLHAQFSFLPYVGFEQSHTTLSYSDASATAINGNLKAGLRFDYRLKGGHSPFINLTTSPAPVRFAFDKAGSLLSTARQSNLPLRLEGGYQYSSKPIQFGKKTGASNQETANTTQKGNCNSLYRSHCGAKKALSKTSPVNSSLNMRLQPSLALAYIPSDRTTIKQTTDGFEYTTGTWKTALVPAMGFEFAKGRQRLFTLGVFYTRPLSQKSENITTEKEGKIMATSLQPKTSSWGLTLGVPFGFAKAKTSKAKTEKKSCSSLYYRRCIRMQ